jgi:hypothetical protein
MMSNVGPDLRDFPQLGLFAAFARSLSAPFAHAQYGPIRQDYRNLRQDRTQLNVDRGRLLYDLNHNNTGAVVNDFNRLRADQRVLRYDQQQLRYDRGQVNPGYYPNYQPQYPYVQPTQYQYVQQQPQYQYVQQQPQYQYAQNVVQRYQIAAEYAGTPAGYVISYGGINYLSGSDGTMTVYTGPVAR